MIKKNILRTLTQSYNIHDYIAERITVPPGVKKVDEVGVAVVGGDGGG